MVYTFSLLPEDRLRLVEAWALFHKPKSPPTCCHLPVYSLPPQGQSPPLSGRSNQSDVSIPIEFPDCGNQGFIFCAELADFLRLRLAKVDPDGLQSHDRTVFERGWEGCRATFVSSNAIRRYRLETGSSALPRMLNDPPKGGFFKCRVLGVLHSSCAQRDAYPVLRSFAFPIDQRQRISKGTCIQIWLRIWR